MGDWLDKLKKKMGEREPLNVPEPPVPPSILTTGITTTAEDPWTIYGSMITGGGTGATSAGTGWIGTLTAAQPAPSPATYTTISNGAFSGITSGTISIPSSFNVGSGMNITPSHLIQLTGPGGKELVKVNNDGSVEWADGYKMDEAAEAFSKTLSMGAELSAGITKKVKLDMRDSVFNDLISIAKEKGSLTAEDLTYLLEASKIVEKLKGGRYDTR